MNRNDILEAAALIISQKGFHATSMQDIAQAVNLQKASLYHHISSKQEILVELLDQALDMLIEQIQAVLEQSLPADRKLRMAMRVYLESMLDRPDLAAVLLLEHRSLEPVYRDRHIPRRDRFERLWRKLIESGLAEDVFYSSDSALTSRALLGVMNWTITWYRPDGALNPEMIAEQFADIFLSGLLKRSTSC